MFRHQLFVLVVGLVLSACSMPHATQSIGGSDMTAASLTAFKDHVRPVLQRCATCHSESQAPRFMATDNEQEAHRMAVGLVDFDDIGKSRLLKRVVKDGHQCGDSGECAALGDELLAALNKWKSARLNNRSSPTGKETIAKTLRQTTEDLTWDIGEMLGSQYKDKVEVKLTVEAKTDQELYILKNLKVRPDGLDVYIGSIKPLLNGASQSTTTFNDLNCKVTTATQDSQLTVVDTGANITPTDFDATNKLSLVFEGLRPAKDNDKNCNNATTDTTSVPNFATVLGILGAENACGSCHGGNGPGRVNAYSTPGNLRRTGDRVLDILNGADANHNRPDRAASQSLDDDDKIKVRAFINSLSSE